MKYLSVIISAVAIILSSLTIYAVKTDDSNPVTEVSYGVNTTAESTQTETETVTAFVYDEIAETETEYEISRTELTWTTTESSTAKPETGEIFHITVYTPYSDGGKWGYSTASGEKAEHLATCAVDPKVIPLGSTVYVNGLTLRANDTGSAVKGNVIDIFYDGTESEALKWISEFGDYHCVEVR